IGTLGNPADRVQYTPRTLRTGYVVQPVYQHPLITGSSPKLDPRSSAEPNLAVSPASATTSGTALTRTRQSGNGRLIDGPSENCSLFLGAASFGVLVGFVPE